MSDVRDLFWGRPMRKQADLLLAVHPRMADYLAQAPVLVPGTIKHRSTDRNRILHLMCSRGEKLRVVLSAFGLAPALRQASGKGFAKGYTCLPVLRHANASSLAQQIQRRPDPADQHLFWEQLERWYTAVRYTNQQWCPSIFWMAENLPPGDHDMAHYGDMFRFDMPERFSNSWSWQQFAAAVRRWEDSFAKAYKGPDPDVPLSPHKMPDHVEIDGLTFVHLNTRRTLAEDGALMRHCVGGYHASVANGLCCIYSLQQERRLATLQIGRKIAPSGKDFIWENRQLKGRCNSRPPKGTQAATAVFLAKLNAEQSA